MNITALQPLAGRWPNDVLPNDRDTSRELHAVITSRSGQSMYDKLFVFDPNDSQHIADFAHENGWSYTLQTNEFNQSAYAGRQPAWLGRQIRTTQPVFAHQITGTIDGFPAQMFVGYTTGSVQNTNTKVVNLIRKSYIRVTLPKVFPQMVLDSNKNDRRLTGSIPTSFKTSQKLRLEGNFAKYFDFYAPLGLQVNTLTVLAPNFMQTLIDTAHMFDVEFYGNEIILVTHEPLYTPEVMDAALKALHEQLTYLQRLFHSWDYEPHNPPFDMLQKTLFEGSVIKIGPIRLSPAQLMLLILAAYVLYAILILVLKHYFPQEPPTP